MAKRKAKAPDATLSDRPSINGRRPIRKLRHWKQQYDQDARFLWRRDVHWDSKTDFKRGDEVPDGLINRTKLRRFWESGWIELLDFSEPTNILTGSTEPVSAPETTVEAGDAAGDAGESSKGSDNPGGVVAPPGDANADESDESEAPAASE